jgi:N-acetylmuramoyl-L-alanine amidase
LLNILKKLTKGWVALLLATALTQPTISTWDTSKVRNFTQSNLICLAKAIYHESRGESTTGMIAVGFVVANRADHAKFPSDFCSVVNQPFQFSWVGTEVKISDKQKWEKAKVLAMSVVDGAVDDPTSGSTHFHRFDLGIDWSSKTMKRTIRIGNHQFYRLA